MESLDIIGVFSVAWIIIGITALGLIKEKYTKTRDLIGVSNVGAAVIFIGQLIAKGWM